MVLPQFSWRRGLKDPSVCFLEDLNSSKRVLAIPVLSFYALHKSAFSIELKSVNNGI
jgi:hypothetical protein